MSITAQIYKEGAWRDFDFLQGQFPTVINRVEENGLFGFVAPMATFAVFAEIQYRFLPGGDWEITRGDEVRVYAYGIHVFSGKVDQDVGHDERSGVTTFRAAGWLAEVNQIYAGRRFPRDEEIYRYVKRDTDQDSIDADGNPIEYEYIAHPSVYETDWQNQLQKRIGFEKKWLFSTRATRFKYVFEAESSMYSEIDDNEGYLRRDVKAGSMFSVSFASIVNELIEQINGESSGYELESLDYTPIVPDYDVTIPLLDQIFLYVMYKSTEIDFVDNKYYCIGFGNDNGLSKWLFVKTVRIYDIISSFNLEERIELEFNCAYQGQPLNLLGFNLGGNGVEQKIDFNDRVFWGLRVYDYGESLVVLQIWSWLEFVFTRDDDGNINERVDVNRHSYAEWIVTSPVTGRNDLYTKFNSIHGRGGEGYINGTLDEISDQLDQVPLHKSLDFNATYTDADFNTDSRQQSPRLEVNDGTYSSNNGVPIFTGSFGISQMGFDFENQKIVDLFYEIARLTNSVFHIDKDKKIYIVSRDHASNVSHDIQNSIIRKSQTIEDNFGDQVPAINSKIIENKYFQTILREYYENTYFQQIHDVWDIELIPDASSAQIVMFDEVYGWEDYVADNPAIVEEVEISINRVRIRVRRSR